MFIRSRNKLRRELWFINAGILSDSAYNSACEGLSSSIEKDQLFNAVIFLSIDYLIHYFELLSINSSKLLILCIKRHLQFVEKLLTQTKNAQRYFASQYWDSIFTICDKFDTSTDYVERQFCIDAIERICQFLTSRTRYWVKSDASLTYLKIFDRKCRNTIVYNSFLIPNFSKYKDPFTCHDQKNFEKIENECACKIILHTDNTDCRIGEHNLMLEVLFDYYKGNFLGFIDNMTYLIKRISPTKHFMKSLRTITQTENMCFIVLSDLPLNQLHLIEKSARMGDAIPPFLDSSVSSKVVFEILITKIKEALKDDLEGAMGDYEDIDYWKKQLTETELVKYKDIACAFFSDHACFQAILKEWAIYKENTNRKPKRNFVPKIISTDVSSVEIEEKPDLSETTSKKHAEKESNATTESKETIETNESNKARSEKAVKISHMKLASVLLKDANKTKQILTDNQANLAPYFDSLYDRVYEMKNEPNNLLNHTLRVMLRCKTEYEYGDEEIAKLDPEYSIHDMLKQYYNFDLKVGTYFTVAQRKQSMITREQIKRSIEKAKERQQYLENRRIIAEKIENASIQVEEPVVEEEEEEEEEVSEGLESMELTVPKESEFEYEDLVIDDDMLFGDIRETKEQLSPEFKKAIFAVFGQLNGDMLQLFNENRITRLSIWNHLKDQIDRFEGKFPYPSKVMPCDATEAYKGQIKPDQVEMVYSSVSTNVYISIKLFSNHDVTFDGEFPKMLKGQGITIAFLTEINKPQSSLPKFHSLIDPRQSCYRKNLNFTICVLSYDIYLICASLSSSFGILFEHHRLELTKALQTCNTEIKDLYTLFQFDEKLDEAKSIFKIRLLNRTKEELGILLKLSEDLRRFNDLLYHASCCRWRRDKGIRILYASMEINGNKKCQEPFLRKGGDRRLKKIETKGNCIITMRLTTHPVTGVQIPFVEIYYDFFKGNHFCAMDLLKMTLAEDRGSTARIVNIRHLVCFPYGELWIVQDLEWLRIRGSYMLAQETQN